MLPSGIVVLSKIAPSRSALNRIAPVRFAPIRFELFSFAWDRNAPNRSA